MCLPFVRSFDLDSEQIYERVYTGSQCGALGAVKIVRDECVCPRGEYCVPLCRLSCALCRVSRRGVTSEGREHSYDHSRSFRSAPNKRQDTKRLKGKGGRSSLESLGKMAVIGTSIGANR